MTSLNYENCLMTLNKVKYESFFKNKIQKIHNRVLYDMLEKNKKSFDEFLSRKKYIYIYHKYDKVSSYILNNKDRLKYKVIIHDPLHCGFSKKERDKADRISCWSKNFVIERIKDNHNKLFTAFYPVVRQNVNDVKSDEPYIISVGNKYRDYNILIKALEGIDIKCIILTNEKSRDYNIRPIINNNPNIIVKNASQPEVIQYIKKAKFGILPLIENDGSGVIFAQAHGITVAAEFVSCNLPFITSHNMGVNEYLVDNVFGVTYNVNDVDDLKKKILYFLDKNIQSEYKEKIINFYENNPNYFSPEHFVEILEHEFSLS